MNQRQMLDATDLRLLNELQDDARLSLAELGRRVGLSAPAVTERLARLEREEVILGYRTTLNPRALGYTLSAVIRIRPAPRQLHEVAQLARETLEVVDCRRITGEDCFIMTAHVRSVEHLEEVIDSFAIHGQTTSSIVQSAPVADRGLSLPEAPSPAASRPAGG
jgi:Lrp/AsnC family leucine-responsive transcriptional regulator